MPSFALDDLARVLVPLEPVGWGPDVVYVLKGVDPATNKGWSHLWRVPVAGGAPVQLTRGALRDHTPVADPAGRFLVFLSDRGGTTQLWRLDREGGEPRRLTAFPDGGLASPALSADGRRVALVYTPQVAPDATPLLAATLVDGVDPDLGPDEVPASETAPTPLTKGEPRARVYVRVRNRLDGKGWEGPGRDQLWEVDVDTGAARRRAAGPWAWGAPTWLPDGSIVAPRAAVPEGDRDPTRNELAQVGPDGTVRVWARPAGVAGPVSVSPDGHTLAWIHQWADDWWGTRNPLPAVVPVAGGEVTLLEAGLDRPAMDLTLDDLAGGAFAELPPRWRGAELVVPFTDHGSVRLRGIGPDGARWLTQPGWSAGFATVVGEQLVAVATSAGSLAEIAVVGPDGGFRALTAHNAALTAERVPRAPDEVWIPGPGGPVHGWYLPPRGTPTGGGILYVHGGPHGNYGARMFFEMAWLADQGWAVLWTNPRGSTSYGEVWCGAIDYAWGGVDRDDLLAAAAWLGGRPGVDPARLGLAGGSYGGWMSLHLAGTGAPFAAYAAQRGLFDWAADYGEGDFGFLTPQLFGDRRPWQAPEAYLAQSPVRLVEHVTAPFLLVCQEADMRCEEAQSLAVFNALRDRGIPTALVVYPEEGHGMMRGGRVDRRMDAMRQIDGWFGRWLGRG